MIARPSGATIVPQSPRIETCMALAVAMLVGHAGPAAATIVNGQITDGRGQGIANVDLDFVDPAGTSIPLTGDTTDALGYYAVTVPADTYTVRFEPAVGDRFVGVADAGVVIAGASQILDRVLQDGFFVTARVVDDAATPQAGAKLRVTDAATRLPMHVPNDTTDALGLVTAVLPTGTFDVLFRPAVIGPLLPATLTAIAVTGDLALGDVVLVRALALSGRVVGEDGPALGGVTVVATNSATGVEAAYGRISTAADGTWLHWLLPGTYRLDAIPPTSSPYIIRRLHGVVVAADWPLPDLVLDRGVLASGAVVDWRATPVRDLDLDFDDVVSGLRALTPHDNTDAAGQYVVGVRRGTFDVGFEPPAGSGLASARLDAQPILADTTLPTITLEAGFTVTGRVLAPGGAPAPLVDVDAIVAASGRKLPLGDDDTGPAGTFSVLVPAGTYDFDFDPPALSGWGRGALPGIVVAGDLDLGDIQLPASTPQAIDTITPTSGPETGGTSVTITGTGFAPGMRASVGGVPLSGIVVAPTMLTGVTGLRPAGVVDVSVTNPGAVPSTLVAAYRYDRVAPDPVILLRRDGPLVNDIRIDWAPTGQPAFTVFRSTDMFTFGEDQIIAASTGTTWRDEGGLLVPGSLVFWIIR